MTDKFNQIDYSQITLLRNSKNRDLFDFENCDEEGYSINMIHVQCIVDNKPAIGAVFELEEKISCVLTLKKTLNEIDEILEVINYPLDDDIENNRPLFPIYKEDFDLSMCNCILSYKTLKGDWGYGVRPAFYDQNANICIYQGNIETRAFWAKDENGETPFRNQISICQKLEDFPYFDEIEKNMLDRLIAKEEPFDPNGTSRLFDVYRRSLIYPY
jgi:hypothetical protein